MSFKINANVIIDGLGGIQEDSAIVIAHGKITYFGSQNSSPGVSRSVEVPVLMPGIWDAHSHLLGISGLDPKAMLTTNLATAGARCVWDLRELLKSGITSIREVGGLGLSLKQVVNEGTHPGPNIYGAGQILSPTGGHADIHKFPLDAVKQLSSQGFLRTVDGVSDCLKAVREQLRAGADVIKICTSGGVMSEIDDPLHQQFSDKEIRAIVGEAKRSVVSVAAHAHGDVGIQAAIKGGCHTIEHGTYLTEELADQMIENDVLLVSTRYVAEKFSESLNDPGVPEHVRSGGAKTIVAQEKALKLAIRKGVKIAMGTDIFFSGPGNIAVQGENALELQYLVKFGMTPMDAIVSATSTGPLTLGARAPKSGQITVGFDADLLLLRSNPVKDISSLADRTNIINVIKNGKVVKIN